MNHPMRRGARVDAVLAVEPGKVGSGKMGAGKVGAGEGAGRSSEAPAHLPVTRGPAEHNMRNRILEVASQCFAKFGYSKTTVSDLAREIGFSKAYIYRFFESKRAIGEAICSGRLERILDEARSAIEDGTGAGDRLQLVFKHITALTVALLFNDRKIFEVAALSAAERWTSTTSYSKALEAMIAEIIRDGRKTGEFERKTPIDEVCRSIFYAMTPFIDPLHLERNLDFLPDAQTELTALILRSLAP